MGILKRDGKPAQPWTKTLSSTLLPPEVIATSNLTAPSFRFIGFMACSLQNGDESKVGTFVIARIVAAGGYALGKITEILQVTGSESELFHCPDIILLNIHSTSQISQKYNMPKIIKTNQYVLVKYEVSQMASIIAVKMLISYRAYCAP